ncbi:entericidin A/B family lipoprotein [Corticimicrobacter populi]|uniref:Entericidin n=1 Tax=Corticimicrobacter populi TaxID=2175229 RepID=A0A2V1K5M1_9BURK|nr:entericidin A/B family lipoprotein [Corticimicrobacter populi]PWF25538.1 entericidin [Corticimicrobacter populi]
MLLCATVLAAGCNTVSGVGKDIERGGEAIQGAAEK